MRPNLLLLVAFLLLVPAASAHPILIRHDADEEAYRVLGERYAASLARLRADDGRGTMLAEGTLIAPRWVLTAAHVARALRPGHEAEIAGRTYTIRRIAVHPDFRGRAHDLALVELERSAEGGTPLPLYRSGDEAGRELIIAGRGMFGTGETGPTTDDMVLRGATNHIDEVGPGWLRFVFDAPGAPHATPLEGISGPGDSGGPGLLIIDGAPYVAGISSGQDDTATGGQPGRYGVSEYYTRVSHYVAWIEQTMAGEPTARVETRPVSAVAGRPCPEDWGLPNSPTGRAASAFLSAVCSGDEAAHRQYIETHLAPDFRDAFPIEDHLRIFGQLHQDVGAAELEGVTREGPAAARLTLAVPSGDRFIIRLEIEETPPHRVTGLDVEREGVGPDGPGGEAQQGGPGIVIERTEGPAKLAPASAPATSDACEDDWGLPGSPRGRAAAAFLSAVCTADEAAHRAFIEEHLAPDFRAQHSTEDILGALRQMHTELDAVRDAGVQPAGEHSVQLEVAAHGEQFLVTLNIEPKPPHRINGIDVATGTVAPLPPPGGTDSRAPLAPDAVAAQLAEYVEALAANDDFSGVVLLAKDGEVLFGRAYGLADRAAGTPNRIDTKLNLGSMNKMFTALAIAQLAEQGRLDFDDLLIEHVPDYPNREVAEQVTLHHLLTHTSGMGFYTFSHGARTPEGILPFYAAQPLAFAPGERFQYSNAGFAALGLVIERVSGMDYYEYLRRHVFMPAGMTDTDSYAHDEDVPNRAIGYTRAGPEGPRQPNTSMLEIKGSPAGGGYSTAPDLLRFGEALKNHTLLGPEHTEILLEGKVPMGPGLNYAYGFGSHRINGHRMVGHNGGAPGVGAEFRVFLDAGYTVVVLTNYDAAVAARISETAQNLIAR